MRLFQRLLKRGIYGFDRNSLQPFEQSLMRAILDLRIPNLLFISLQAQIKTFTKFRSTHMSGVPDWLKRRVDNERIVVKLGRFIGAEYSAPSLEPDPSFEFALELGNGQRGAAEFLVRQSIDEFSWSFPCVEETYSERVVTAKAKNITDDRAYWAAKQDELGRIGTAVYDVIQKCQFTDNVIVCPSWNCESSRLFGLDLSPSYQQVLRFADGIFVNGLSILGSVELRNRVIEEKGVRYLHIGDDQDAWYYYRIGGDAINEQVTRFKRGTTEAEVLDLTLVDLLWEALN